MPKTRTKKTAAPYVCQSRQETMDAIKTLGDAQRELIRIETKINDAIAEITSQHKGEVDALKMRIEELIEGVHWWCEANRSALCAGGGKSANLITGEVAWRKRPASVTVRGVDKVLAYLNANGLKRFVRTKEEINKEAILAEPKSIICIPGLTLVQGVEDFSVTPFEVEVQP
ncbi:MAG: host-nuclease inhibitor Gam family protein [Zoogloeaceae bacterium]|jgi:phage host-nuclease inhibitor protein Gam|nr:host-nuclease inhibitor Gam family protein [Zoogloeaceae bacterium]